MALSSFRPVPYSIPSTSSGVILHHPFLQTHHPPLCVSLSSVHVLPPPYTHSVSLLRFYSFSRSVYEHHDSRDDSGLCSLCPSNTQYMSVPQWDDLPACHTAINNQTKILILMETDSK